MSHTFTQEERERGSRAPKLRMKQAYRQSLELQKLMHQMAMDTKLKATERASAARVWVDLCDQGRIIAGIGLPKSVPAANDPASASPKRKPAAALSESSDGPA